MAPASLPLSLQLRDIAPSADSDDPVSTESHDGTAGSGIDTDGLRVLSISANPTASFYQRQLRVLGERGVECTTISPPPYDPEEGRSPVQYVRLWIETLSHVVDEYDVVHANYGLVGPIALAQPRRPVVLTLWGTDVMSSGWVTSVSKAAATYCDAVIAPSKRLAASLSCESYVVQFDVDMDLFRPIPQSGARQALGWDHDAEIVLFPYGERAVKNPQMARRVVDRQSVDVQLKQVSEAAHEEMPLYYNASDAVIVTSEREAGPMVVKEAAACNVPVVSTDVGFVSELLDGIDGSHVVDSESAFVERLDDVLRCEDASRSRSVVAQHNKMGERLVAIYDAVV